MPIAIPPLRPRLCRRAGALAVICGVGFLVVNALLWLVPDFTEYAARELSGLHTERITLTPLVVALCLVLTTAYGCVLLRGLWILRTLLRQLAAGVVFVTETAVLLRRLARTLILYAALTPVVASLGVLLVTLRNPDGEHRIQIGLSDHEVTLALLGVLLLALGSVMADAAKLATKPS